MNIYSNRINILQNHLALIDEDSSSHGYFWYEKDQDPLFIIGASPDLNRLRLIELIEYAERVLFSDAIHKTDQISQSIFTIQETLTRISHAYYKESNEKEGLPPSYLPAYVHVTLDSFSQSQKDGSCL